MSELEKSICKAYDFQVAVENDIVETKDIWVIY